MRRISLLLLLSLFVSPLFAQQNNVVSRSLLTAVSEETPFWMHSNQMGMINSDRSSLVQFFSGENSSISNDGKIKITAKASGVVDYTNELNINAQEWYLESVFGKLSLMGGAKNFRDGFISNPVSLGSMGWSNNAVPVPMLKAELIDYVSVTKDGSLGFKAMLAHGWLEEDRFASEAQLHMKSLGIRIGNPGSKVVFEGNASHLVIWAGNLNDVGPRFSNSFSNLLDVVFFNSNELTNSGTSEFTDVPGNTRFIFDTILNIDLKQSELRIGKQFIQEQGENLALDEPTDGLYSIEWRNRSKPNSWLNYAVYQHMTTLSQRDVLQDRSYYSDLTYSEGWTFENRGLGNPLISYQPGIDGFNYLSNNIISAHHIGLAINFDEVVGSKNQIELLLRGTYSRNYGTNFLSFDQGGPTFSFLEDRIRSDFGRGNLERMDQFYSAIGLLYQYNDFASIIVNAAFDVGEIQDNFGLQVGVQYNFSQ